MSRASAIERAAAITAEIAECVCHATRKPPCHVCALHAALALPEPESEVSRAERAEAQAERLAGALREVAETGCRSVIHGTDCVERKDVDKCAACLARSTLSEYQGPCPHCGGGGLLGTTTLGSLRWCPCHTRQMPGEGR